MQELPQLLLSYGIDLKATGNEFSCLCFAHDDHNPSMRIYINGSGKYVAHCFSCGFHEGIVGVYCKLNDLDVNNKDHLSQAIKALDAGDINTGKQYARIEDNTPKVNPRTERTMIIPPPDQPMPKMDWLKGRDGVQWGEPSEVYIFRTATGAPWMYESRWNITADTGEINKECRCFSWGRRGSAPPKWECSHHLPPRPLYGLDMLAKMPDKQIVITEGPRKAFYAQQLLPMVPCMGWAGGANGWDKSDWSPITKKSVILWPDADIPGKKCMDEIAQQLIGQDCEVYILNTDDMPESWDAADAVNDGWDTPKTLSWAKANKGEKVEKKTPTETEYSEDQPPLIDIDDEDYDLPDPVPVSKKVEYSQEHNDLPFPSDPVDLFHKFVVPPLERGLLPGVIENYVFDRAEIINTDPAFGALTAIITCAGLIDDRIRLRVSHDWFESARLWGCIVGEPSTKKSPIMDSVLNSSARALVKAVAAEDAEIGRKQAILDKRYAARMKDYEKACIESDYPDTPVPDAPVRMERKRILCDNLTREGLEEVLRDVPTGILLAADEIAGWIGSMDAYKSAGVKSDRAYWLRAYNGGSMQIDKVGRGSYLIENWSVSIIGGIQPSKLREMAGQLDDDGLLQRFLVVCSDRAGGVGSERSPNEPATMAWQAMTAGLYKHKGKMIVEMSPDAQEIRRKAVLDIYKLIEAGTISRAFCTHLGKWEGLTARMMLTFHCVECAEASIAPDVQRIGKSTAEKAIGYMMRHLLPHAVAFYEDGLGSSDIQDAARIMAGRILAEKMPELTMRWLGRNSPSRWRNMSEDKQRQVLSRLIESGWILPVGLADGLTRRHGRYLVNPAVHAIFANKQREEALKLDSARKMADEIKAGRLLNHDKKIY